MKSVKSIFKIGKGPSSSHTMGPFKAVTNYIENHPEAKGLHVTLYGSLAATGKGHLTDKAIEEAAANAGLDVVIAWEPKENLPEHPNGMVVASVAEDGSLASSWTYYSVGGGDIKCMDIELADEDGAEVYEMSTMKEILDWCNKNGKAFWEFVQENEEKTKGFWEHIELVWKTMQKAVERGIDEEGALPGPLNIRRKAGSYYIKADGYGDVQRARGLIFAYALAVSEENACGGKIVTAPTCGSCGVLPGVLYHLKKVYGFSDQRIIRALATAGIIGNIVKHNASISGAEVGCQGEV
jgi:L-serine dehydratase